MNSVRFWIKAAPRINVFVLNGALLISLGHLRMVIIVVLKSFDARGMSQVKNNFKVQSLQRKWK